MTNPTVVTINVTPRVEKDKLGKHEYEVMYDPGTKRWDWIAHITQTYDLRGNHTSLDLAKAAARKAITKFTKDNDQI